MSSAPLGDPLGLAEWLGQPRLDAATDELSWPLAGPLGLRTMGPFEVVVARAGLEPALRDEARVRLRVAHPRGPVDMADLLMSVAVTARPVARDVYAQLMVMVPELLGADQDTLGVELGSVCTVVTAGGPVTLGAASLRRKTLEALRPRVPHAEAWSWAAGEDSPVWGLRVL